MGDTTTDALLKRLRDYDIDGPVIGAAADAIEHLTAERDATQRRRTELGVMLVDETERAEKAEAERDAALEDARRLREALAELVALKDMKKRLHDLHEMGHGTDWMDYHRLKPLAWDAARAALAAQKGDDSHE